MPEFVEIAIEPDMHERAQKRAKEMGPLRNTINGERSNYIGFLGEEAVLQYLKLAPSALADTYNFDIISPTAGKLEIKTKLCTTPPKSEYNCTVAAANFTQVCDKYVFVRVMSKTGEPSGATVAFVLGFTTPIHMKRFSVFRRAGDVEGAFTFRADCWNIEASKLAVPRLLLPCAPADT
jgi:hypothetical protein